jgi:hypothetical protein
VLGDLPATNQPTSEAGDFLGCVGNSGNSSAPHLHVSKSDNFAASPTDYGAAAALRFRIFRWRDQGTNVDTASTAMNAKIPDAAVAVTPPAADPGRVEILMRLTDGNISATLPKRFI